MAHVLVSTLKRQRQEDCFKFEIIVVHRASSRIARDKQRNPVSKEKKRRKKKRKSKVSWS